MTTTESAKEPAGELYIKTDISPEQIFQAIGRLRREARKEIDRLIRFLDETDDHMELEPEDEGDDSDDEPSLGSLDHAMNQSRWANGEQPWLPDCELDQSDDEPLLGSLESYPTCVMPSDLRAERSRGEPWFTPQGSQLTWAGGNSDDREGDGCADDREAVSEDEGAEHDGREPDTDAEQDDSDKEPSLGWTVDGVCGGSYDHEQCPMVATAAARQRYQRRHCVEPESRMFSGTSEVRIIAAV